MTTAPAEKILSSTSKNVLFLDGFHQVPWMMDRLLEHFSDKQDFRLTYLVINCYQRNSKTMERSFDPTSVAKVEQALMTGNFHAVCVVDLTQFGLDDLTNHFGKVLQRFCASGGALAFPVSEMSNFLSSFTKLFETQWLPGDYNTATKWVLESEQNDRVADYFGSHPSLTQSFEASCVSLFNVPTYERIYAIEPSQRQTMQTPTTLTPGSTKTTSEEKQESDYNVCVAIHNYGLGCLAFFGDVDLKQPDLLFLFLQTSSPIQPIDALAKLNKDTFERVKSLKLQGNDLFGQQNYKEAIEKYQQAVELYGTQAGSHGEQQQEHAILYSNIAECCLRLHEYDASIQAASKALEQSPTMVKAAVRYAKARVAMAHQEKNRHYLELADHVLKNIPCPESEQEQISLGDMTKKVEGLLLEMEKKQKDGFRSGFASALSSA